MRASNRGVEESGHPRLQIWLGSAAFALLVDSQHGPA